MNQKNENGLSGYELYHIDQEERIRQEALNATPVVCTIICVFVLIIAVLLGSGGYYLYLWISSAF